MGRNGTSEVHVVVTDAGEATFLWRGEEERGFRYVVGQRGGGFGPVATLAGYEVDFAFAGLSPLVTRGDGTTLLLAKGLPEGFVLLSRSGGTGFVPVSDGLTDRAHHGAGLAAAGDHVLAVWQTRFGDPESGEESGRAVMRFDPALRQPGAPR
jgi:hypothetical protein